MALENKFVLDVDLKEVTYAYERKVIQNDSITFIININDDGSPIDMTGVTSISLANTRPDQSAVVTNGIKTGSNQVTFNLGSNETSQVGRVTATVQLYDVNGRISSLGFHYTVIKDPTGNGFVPSETEKTLIEVVLSDGPLAIKNANDAATYAKTQGDAAVSYSKTQTDTAVANANTQATYAKAQGDAVKTTWKTPVANYAAIATTYPSPKWGDTVQTLDDGKIYRYETSWVYTQKNTDTAVSDIQAKLAGTDRQTQTLSYGSNVINSDQTSPLDIEITGNTLVSLGNSKLKNGGKYVIADDRSKVKVLGTTYDGVGKFQLVTTMDTSDFTGKIANSVIENANLMGYSAQPILNTPSGYWASPVQSYYDQVKALNNDPFNMSNLSSGNVSQVIFSFNLIEHVKRKYGFTPTINWLRTSILNAIVNWHGYGNGPSANKATVARWVDASKGWSTYDISNNHHSNSVVTKISINSSVTDITSMVDGNGFIHILAYAPASDGVTASSIRTDYVDLQIYIDPSTVLPVLIRKADFSGKIYGSTVENPNMIKGRGEGSTTLMTPSAFEWETSTVGYSQSSFLDGVCASATATSNGNIPQWLFSFNLIEEVERNLGKIPVQDKAAWLRSHVTKITANWHGFGIGPSGNQAYLKAWNGSGWSPSDSSLKHSSNTVSKLTLPISDMVYIQPDGFVHYMAYTDASNGTTASTINTDYMDIEIEVNPNVTTRLTQTTNFIGKVSGSNVENANVTKVTHSTTLETPSGTWANPDMITSDYTLISSLNNQNRSTTVSTNNSMSEMLFTFNLVEHVKRKYGYVPTVEWLKTHIARLTFNWHGYGSGPSGNKAYIRAFWGTTGAYGGALSHTSATVAKIVSSYTSGADIRGVIDSNGFVSYIAYADPSNGTVASVIHTDFVELEVELVDPDMQSSLVLKTDFAGKVAGSTTANANIAKHNGLTTTTGLFAPSSFVNEQSASGYTSLSLLDNSITSPSTTTNNTQAQQLFSFNLIEHVRRKYGFTPTVDWLKMYVLSWTCNWHGYGSGPSGNKATLAVWMNGTNSWGTHGTNTTGLTSKVVGVSNVTSIISDRIDSNGFVHFIAYADASNGTTASTINTDFVELEITLKPYPKLTRDDVLRSPKVPLYEVSDTEYTNILTSWTKDEVLRRYPSVEGMQHIQNPIITVEGENLLPPFTEWVLNANATMVNSYELELNATGYDQYSRFLIYNLVPGQPYTFGATMSAGGKNEMFCYDAISGGNLVLSFGDMTTPITVTPTSQIKRVEIRFTNRGSGNGKFTFKNPIMNVGSTLKPFTPRNPSYLYADVKLGSLGAVKDILYKQDGSWLVRRAIQKDVSLDGGLVWSLDSDGVTNKQFSTKLPFNGLNSVPAYLVKYNGTSLTRDLVNSPLTNNNNKEVYNSGTTTVWICVLDSDTGFPEAYSPTADEIKAYFNGWKAAVTDANGKPTSWVSLVDGSAPSTNTLAYVSTNRATNFTPYKLSYQLTAPIVEPVTVEGDLVVNGLTQVDVGSGVIVREDINPIYRSSDNRYFINVRLSSLDRRLSNRLNKFINIYKNDVMDTNRWIFTKDTTTGYGNYFAYIDGAVFDPTAEYSVTYEILDKHQFTSNPNDLKSTFAKNIRSVVEDTVKKQSDIETGQTILKRQMLDVLVRLEALEGV